MFINQRHWLLSAADKGANGGASSDDPVAQAFEKLLERKGGDTYATAMMLFEENKKHRDRIADLNDQLPGEGAVVLSASEAKDWEAYKAFGSVSKVRQGLDQRDQLQSDVESLHREATLRKVAEVAGFKLTVLAERDELARARGKDLAFEVREVEANGVRAQVAFVKEGDVERTLNDYAEEHWVDVLPVLRIQPQTTQSNGKPFLAQHPGTGGAKPLNTKAQAEAVLSKAYQNVNVE
jgi:hypothetical protein